MQRLSHIISFCFLLLTNFIFAQSPSTGFFNVKAYGAAGDGKTIDSKAINTTIEAASAAGGGTVYFPAGNYLSYSIHLKSHISLFIDQGAVIVAAEAPKDSSYGYDAPEPNAWDKYQDFGHSHWHNSLIWGENLEYISITGTGIINGKNLTRNGNPKSGVANKTISLKLCRNVIIRDITILQGGHFAILATGVDILTVDNVKMDTNRDGMDIDACQHVLISNCSVNSPWDDAICLKSSFALGYRRVTKEVAITNCLVSGYDRSSFINGTYERKEAAMVPDRDGPTGRIKFGTESNGGFKNITISNCVFEFCRGIALETVDGAELEDVTITNITMRDIINSPIFLRLGSRMRGPEGIPVGKLQRVIISNITVYNADSAYACIISGIPGHDIEDIQLNNIKIVYKGGAAQRQLPITVPEKENNYPEPAMFGVTPVSGFIIRHAKNIEFNNIDISYLVPDARPVFLLNDVKEVHFINIKAQHAQNVPPFVLQQVENFSIIQSRDIKDKIIKQAKDTNF